MISKKNTKIFKTEKFKQKKILPDGISTKKFQLFKELNFINRNFPLKKMSTQIIVKSRFKLFCSTLKDLTLKQDKIQDIQFKKKIISILKNKHESKKTIQKKKK